MGYGLWYLRGKYFSLTVLTIFYWENDVDERKITSGGSFFLSEFLVSWLRKKQA